MWYLRWAPYAVGHLVDPFFTQQLNAPFGVNVMWNTPIFAISLIASPVTLLFGPVVAYNVVLTVGVAASAWCAFLALRRYTTNSAAALVGGAVYGFSPYVVQQAAFHLDLALAFIPPLFLLVLDELAIRRRRSALMLGVILGFLSAIQLLTEEEVLLLSVLFAALVACVLAWRWRVEAGRLRRRVLVATAAATVTFGVLCAVPLAVQFFGPQRVQGPLQDADTFSTDLLNPLVPTQYQLVAPHSALEISSHFSGLNNEANAYVGLPLMLLLVAFAVRHWHDIRVRAASIVAVVALVLSMGPHLHIAGQSTGWPLPFIVFTHVPLLEDIQPNRIVIMMWLAIAVLIAIALDRALARQRWQGAAFRLGAVGLALAVVLPAALPVSSETIPAFFRQWARQGISDTSTVLVAPFFRDGAGASPMLWAAVAGDGLRMPEAYAFTPLPDGRPIYGAPETAISKIMETIQDTGETLVVRRPLRDQVARELRELDVQDVVVGPMDRQSQMVAFFTDLLGRPPRAVDGVYLWAEVERRGVTDS